MVKRDAFHCGVLLVVLSLTDSPDSSNEESHFSLNMGEQHLAQSPSVLRHPGMDRIESSLHS